MDPSPGTDLNRTGFLRWAAQNFGANTTETLLELYKVGSEELPDYYHAAVDVVSDYMMWCPRMSCGWVVRRRNRRFARWHSTNRGANSTYVRLLDFHSNAHTLFATHLSLLLLVWIALCH